MSEQVKVGVAFLNLYIFEKSTLCEELLPWLNRMKIFTEVDINQMYNYEQFKFYVEEKLSDNSVLCSWFETESGEYDLRLIQKELVNNFKEAFGGIPMEKQLIFSFTILLPHYLEEQIDIMSWMDDLRTLCKKNPKVEEKTRRLVDMLRSEKAKRLCSVHRQEECYECIDRDSRCYQFNSYYDENRDWMACEITRAYEPVPFTTIIKRFKHQGFEPLFSHLFISSEWGNDEDLKFLAALWDSMFPKTKMDLSAIREKYTKMCYPSEDNLIVEEEPLLFRKPLSSIVKMGRFDTNQIY